MGGQSRRSAPPQAAAPVAAGQAQPPDLCGGMGNSAGQEALANIMGTIGGFFGMGDDFYAMGWNGGRDPNAPRTGLGAYDVVPDDFDGELGEHMMRASDMQYLSRFDFGDFKVQDDSCDFEDDDLEMLGQQEFDSLAQSWLAIRDGTGMKMSGSEEDQGSWLDMIRAGMTDSPTMRGLVTDIGTSEHAFDVDLGHDQDSVLDDYFQTDQVDLLDIGWHPTEASGNEDTRGETIVHILAERFAAVNSSDPTDFDTHHDTATRMHNAYRAERGQSAEVGAHLDLSTGIATKEYADDSKVHHQLDRATRRPNYE